MPKTPRNKPTGSGPGRGTPRSRTTARPGERAPRSRVAPLNQTEVSEALDSRSPLPRASATWRLVVLLAVVAGMAIVLANSLRVYFDQARQIAEVKTEIANEQERIADLEDRLARWDDPEYVRSVARVRLGWVMPGETGYRVIGADGKPIERLDAKAEKENPRVWWEKMWGSVALADQPVEEEQPPATPSAAPPTDRIIGSPEPSETP